jgi:hypothetical protein
MEDADRYRCRRIHLKPGDNPAFQAESACEALANIEGILLAAPWTRHCIHIIYSLDTLSFEIVVELLHELEFETDDSLFTSLRNTIFSYLEDNARDNMPVDTTALQPQNSEIVETAQLAENEKYWDDYR